MGITNVSRVWSIALLLTAASMAVDAQSFRIQCPAQTITHPTALAAGMSEPAYTSPSENCLNGVCTPTQVPNGAVKCQQVSGGDGYMTEADGNQTFMFSFGPLSGLDLIKNGLPGTQFAADFNHPYADGPNYPNGQLNPYFNNGALGATKNGAVGYVAPASATSPTPGADPAAIMNIGVMNGNIPAPLIAIDEDDELFLTLSNVGMIMRPDLFEQHTIHFHGYPNASAFYDGVPDASLAINIGGSFTYYYLAPDAGTYFWHCHITPPEHLQMGMVGQLYVRPRQNRVPDNRSLYASLKLQQSDLRTACNVNSDLLCSVPMPASDNGAIQPAGGAKYAYNDGDGTTRYDIDVPLQIHGFDPNFHFVGMTFNPEGFSDMKDKYFLLNGRSYPDTVSVANYQGLSPASTTNPATGGNNSTTLLNPDPASNSISTQDSDGYYRPSQPLPSLVTLNSKGGPNGTGQRALLRISDLDVTEYQTLASMGIPMQVVGFNAKILRDQAGNNMYYTTNSITLAGGESLDVILDSTGVPPGTYFLFTPQLDHLSNDAENFGGLMTEVVVL